MANTQENNYLTPVLTAVFAVGAGLAVGNLYWAQPLLAQIAADFGIPTAEGGMLVTATQIGYALGILLLVPLGDILNRRRLISGVMGASVLALLASAWAPSFALLAMAISLVGFTSVSGQIIIPLTGDLATAEQRGRAVGTVTAGIVVGILIARMVSGLAADMAGWRMVYVGAAIANLVIAGVINRAVPTLPKREPVSYPALLADVFRCLRATPTLLRIMAIAGLSFGMVFNMFWTSVTFLLSAEPYGFSTTQIGLVSLAGVAGAVVSSLMGRLADSDWRITVLGASTLLCGLSMGAAIFLGESLVALVVIAATFSVAIQGVSVLCQTRLFALDQQKRSRLNTCFVVGNFVCGAFGSSLATALWNLGGWQAVMAGATAGALTALLVWLGSRRAFSQFDEELFERSALDAERTVLR